MQDGKPRSEILWGTDNRVSIQITGVAEHGYFLGVYHTFVQRYIDNVLKRLSTEVEVYKFYLSRGHFPEAPKDLLGDNKRHSVDSRGYDLWTSIAHISGPYLADQEYLTSQFSAERLEDISPSIPFGTLLQDRAAYVKNPRDLRQFGIHIKDPDDGVNLQMYEELVLRDRVEKPIVRN